MGFGILLNGIIAMIIGGSRSPLGVFLGSALLAAIENCAILFLPAMWKNSVAFAVLIAFLVLRPQGILGEREMRVS